MSQLFPAWLNKLTTYCKFHTFATTISWSYPCRVLSGVTMNRLYTPLHKGEGIPRWAPSIPTFPPHSTHWHTCARQHRASQVLAGPRASSPAWPAEPWQVGAGQRRAGQGADLHQACQGTRDDGSTSIPWHDFVFSRFITPYCHCRVSQGFFLYMSLVRGGRGREYFTFSSCPEHVSTSTPTTVIQKAAAGSLESHAWILSYK